MTSIGFVKRGRHIGVREFRENLSKVIKGDTTYFVTEHGKPVRAVLSYKVLLELLEAVEELRDRALIREIALGRKEYQEGGWVPAGRLKKMLREDG